MLQTVRDVLISNKHININTKHPFNTNTIITVVPWMNNNTYYTYHIYILLNIYQLLLIVWHSTGYHKRTINKNSILLSMD
jgi:hypothetical protein